MITANPKKFFYREQIIRLTKAHFGYREQIIPLGGGARVDPELKWGSLGSWMPTKDPPLNAAENDFQIEI